MTKKALCVGINDYPGTENDLFGCVNDAHEWADLLREHFDFAMSDVKVLLDAEATKANIIKGIEDLLYGAQDGDVLVFTNSSHGIYVADKGGDEPDQVDEALCPHDCRTNLLLDDELRELFLTVPDGVSMTVILDSCFSGTATKAAGDTYRRTMPPGALGLPEVDDVGKHLRRLRATSEEVHPESEMKELLLSGCDAHETCLDLPFNGENHGLMTHLAIRAIRDANGEITFSELHSRLQALIDAELLDRHRVHQQHPQLEGEESNKQRKVFR